MSPLKKCLIGLVVFGLVITVWLTTTGLAVPRVQVAPHRPTVALIASSAVDWAAEAQEADQAAADTAAAIAQLAAEQAQALADQRSLAAVPAPQAVPPPVVVSPASAPCSAPNPVLAWIAWCESGCNPTSMNHGGSGAAGKYQYLYGTWNQYGGYDNAAVAPEYVQDQRAAEDYARVGTGPWVSSQGCWGGKV